jgi:hypothetical protein
MAIGGAKRASAADDSGPLPNIGPDGFEQDLKPLVDSLANHVPAHDRRRSGAGERPPYPVRACFRPIHVLARFAATHNTPMDPV